MFIVCYTDANYFPLIDGLCVRANDCGAIFFRMLGIVLLIFKASGNFVILARVSVVLYGLSGIQLK